MKVKIIKTFDLEDEGDQIYYKEHLHAADNARAYAYYTHEFEQHMRGLLKHAELTDEVHKALDELRDKYFEFKNEAKIHEEE
jgi:hypothetical protein